MKKDDFVKAFRPHATSAGKAFNINPVTILAQAAIESGWGQSVLSREHSNFFGILAYGRVNIYWRGEYILLGTRRLRFRCYEMAEYSFMDYGLLLDTRYRRAADLSFDIEAFARAISTSPYISEVNGDDREQYRRTLVEICRSLQLRIEN